MVACISLWLLSKPLGMTTEQRALVFLATLPLVTMGYVVDGILRGEIGGPRTGGSIDRASNPAKFWLSIVVSILVSAGTEALLIYKWCQILQSS